MLDEIVPDRPTVYTLEIAPGYIEGGGQPGISLLQHRQLRPVRRRLSLTVAGEEQKKGDLAFAVYEYEVTTYFSLKQYAVICAGLLLLAAGLTFGMRRAFPGAARSCPALPSTRP